MQKADFVLLVFALTVEAVSAASAVSLRWKSIAAKHLAAAGLPDPKCKTGIIGLRGKVCCAGYCGECTDYPTCANVREQDSKNACCASKVLSMKCGHGGPPANVCLKKCSDAVPPCIMDFKIKIPQTDRVAADDCNEAVVDWRNKARNAIQQAKESLPTPTTFTTTSTTPVTTTTAEDGGDEDESGQGTEELAKENLVYHEFKKSAWCHKHKGEETPDIDSEAGDDDDFTDHPQLEDLESCARHCAELPECKYFLYKDDPTNKRPFRCATFRDCKHPDYSKQLKTSAIYKMGEKE